MHVVAVYNVKGGVGKTTTSLNLAHLSATAGYRTLLWDLDEQGGASTILGHPVPAGPRNVRRSYELARFIEQSSWPDVDLIAADHLVHLLDRHDRPSHLKELLARVVDSYDRVILDCPPTLGIATEQILALADLIVVPIIPSSLAVAGFQQLQAYAEARDDAPPEFLPVYSMVDRRRRSHREALVDLPERLAIPYASTLEQVATMRRPITQIARGNRAAEPLRHLWDMIEQRAAVQT
jgi:cellulose biosynthesis protein BcsQ